MNATTAPITSPKPSSTGQIDRFLANGFTLGRLGAGTAGASAGVSIPGELSVSPTTSAGTGVCEAGRIAASLTVRPRAGRLGFRSAPNSAGRLDGLNAT